MALGSTQPLTEMEYFLRCKGGRCVWLINLLPSGVDCLKIWEPHLPGTLRGCPGLLQGLLYLLRLFITAFTIARYLFLP